VVGLVARSVKSVGEVEEVWEEEDEDEDEEEEEDEDEDEEGLCSIILAYLFSDRLHRRHRPAFIYLADIATDPTT
jgi:hypothetical protein